MRTTYLSLVVVLLLHELQDSVQQLDPQALHHGRPQALHGPPDLSRP